MKQLRTLLLLAAVCAAGGTASAASDYQWTWTYSGATSFVLSSFSSAELFAGSTGAQDPTLTLQIGKRYEVTSTQAATHPFQVIALGATDVILLSQGGTNGSLESDPDIAWQDNGAGVATFTMTAGLETAMQQGGRTPGYRCGVHTGTMRGSFTILAGATPTDTPSPTPSPTATDTATDTPSPSATDTATEPPTETPTDTPSNTPSSTPSPTPSPLPPDYDWTWDYNGSQSFVLASVSSGDLNASVGAEDPTLTLQLGKRYAVSNPFPSVHPFQVIAKGASDFVLLSLGAILGSMENDPEVAWTDDGSVATFTMTEGLLSAMLVSGHVPGYRCGIHTTNMRGDFNVVAGVTPTETPSPTGTPFDGRSVADFDNSGCTDITDFLFLLDNWQLDFNGTPVALDDFLALLDNWFLGPNC